MSVPTRTHASIVIDSPWVNRRLAFESASRTVSADFGPATVKAVLVAANPG